MPREERFPVMRRFVALMAILVTAACCAAAGAQADVIKIDGTSDITDSNLEAGLIVPGFAAASPGDALDYHADGSGTAITNAENPANGYDVILVHSASLEAPFVAGGYSYEPLGRAIFYNDYVIVGPKTDPAGVLSAHGHDAVSAFQDIAAAGAAGHATFITRNDNSGTNTAEQTIWGQTTGLTLQKATNAPVTDTKRKEPWDGVAGGTGLPAWYGIGQPSQGDNLIATNTCNTATYPNGACYTMVDRGTYYYETSLGNTSNLQIVSQDNAAGAVGGASELTNPFHAYIVKTAPHLAAAQRFVDYLTSASFQSSLVGFPGNGLTSVFPDAFAQIASSTIPTHATAGSTITVSAKLVYPPPVAKPIAGMPVQLQQSATGADGTYADVGAPAGTDATGAVTFTPTLGSATTYYRLSMGTFDSTALASRFSANTNSALGTQSGRVDADPVAPVPVVTTPVAKPSNVVKLTSLLGRHRGAIAFKLTFPAAGHVAIKTTAHYAPRTGSPLQPVTYSGVRFLTIKGQTSVTVTIRPGLRGRNALKHDKKFRAAVAVSYTPTGGTKRTTTKHVTVHA